MVPVRTPPDTPVRGPRCGRWDTDGRVTGALPHAHSSRSATRLPSAPRGGGRHDLTSRTVIFLRLQT